MYVEAVDAIDLNADHLEDDEDDDDDEGERPPTGDPFLWDTFMEFHCPTQQTDRKNASWTWRTPVVEGTNNPSWNEGNTFPIDFLQGSSLPSVKISVGNNQLIDEDDPRQGTKVIGACHVPIEPVFNQSLYFKRLFDEDGDTRGYVAIRMGFVPFGYRLIDIPED